MTKRVLVVGSGAWATRLVSILSDKTNFLVIQYSAREFIAEKSIRTMRIGADLAISATTPELQEKIALKLMLNSRHLWLEKPAAKTNESAIHLIKKLQKSEDTYCLFNFSWTFSAIWKRFLELNLKFEDAESIEISRRADEHSHKFLSTIEDYGSHDLSLLNAWVLRDKDRNTSFTAKNLSENAFQLKSGNILIHWNIKFGFSNRSMIWKIYWKNGEMTCIDFYNRKLRHQDVEIEAEKFDTIDAFIEALFAREKNLMQINHRIALWTKEISSRLLK